MRDPALPGGYRFPRLAFVVHCVRRWTVDLVADAAKMLRRR